MSIGCFSIMCNSDNMNLTELNKLMEYHRELTEVVEDMRWSLEESTDTLTLDDRLSLDRLLYKLEVISNEMRLVIEGRY